MSQNITRRQRQIIPAVVEVIPMADGTTESRVWGATTPRGQALLSERNAILRQLASSGVAVTVETAVPTAVPATEATTEPKAA